MDRIREIFINVTSILIITVMTLSCGGLDEDVELYPYAGPSFEDVENDGYVVTLGAVPAEKGQKAVWRIYSGENGVFEDSNDPKTRFFGEPGESYLIGWEISEKKFYKADVISVSFKGLQPSFETIPSDTIKGNISLVLDAEAPKYGATGLWEIVSGDDGEIMNPESPNAGFVGLPNEKYTVMWSLLYGTKKESLEVTFITDELEADAGQDNLDIITTKSVYPKYYTLDAFLPAGAVGEWKLISGENGKIYTNNNANSLFEGIADTDYQLSWTVQLNEYVSVDTVDLRFRGKWGVWTDERDGQTYRFTEVNGLEWMADNYNYAANPGTGSWYYGHAERSIIEDGYALESSEDRKKYGRLYSLETAKTSAPEGWRLPTAEEIDLLISILGGASYASERLIDGGDTGIDLNFPGILAFSSVTDPAFRHVFRSQENGGVYWTEDASADFAKVYQVFKDVNQTTTGIVSIHYNALSVRYVREIQE